MGVHHAVGHKIRSHGWTNATAPMSDMSSEKKSNAATAAAATTPASSSPSRYSSCHGCFIIIAIMMLIYSNGILMNQSFFGEYSYSSSKLNDIFTTATTNSGSPWVSSSSSSSSSIHRGEHAQRRYDEEKDDDEDDDEDEDYEDEDDNNDKTTEFEKDYGVPDDDIDLNNNDDEDEEEERKIQAAKTAAKATLTTTKKTATKAITAIAGTKTKATAARATTAAKATRTTTRTTATRATTASSVATTKATIAATRTTAATTNITRSPLARPSRKIVLLGPHDRYNFGDLLFERVLSKLLVLRAGYRDEEIMRGGVLPIDMSYHDGHDNILSMRQIVDMSRRDKKYGPYDIVFTGGESGGCHFECAVRMLPTPEMRQLAKREKIHDCGYIIPKEFLLPPTNASSQTKTNYAIANSLGAVPTATTGGRKGTVACRQALATVDFAAYRDRNPFLTPDCAVMTKELYKDVIDKRANGSVLKDLISLGLKVDSGEEYDINKVNYIAVQHKQQTLNAKILAQTLDEVSRKAGNVTIVFFAAGTVPGHDSFHSYQQVQGNMTQPSIVYQGDKTWDVVALISKARAVLCTSLHVRIMSHIFFRPRVTWCSGKKHGKFIELWDTSTASRCVRNMQDTWPAMNQELIRAGLGVGNEMDKQKYRSNVEKYLETFDKWTSMLIAPRD